jgi:2-(1,2-epoxy-1,2-dihydrophenyl)acetyl-CoA isomerase
MRPIRLEREGAVAVITIDRPERFNSLDVETAQDLRRAGLQAARDSALRAVVLRGAGGVFCSGADLKAIQSGECDADLSSLRGPVGEPATHGDRFKQILEYLHGAIAEIRRAPKPFIAAVDGVAAAGGFAIAMACDLVLASERASFEWAYSKTGLPGAESATFLLPRLIGLRRCLGLVFLNPRLDARAALEMGLVNAVYPVGRFEEEVRGVAERLAAGPTRAYAVAKRLLNQAAGMDRLELHLDEEIEQLTRVADGADVAGGIESFLARRPARFEGG